MAKLTVFEELSRELPEDERRRLHNRIVRDLEKRGRGHAIHVGLRGEERKRLLDRELRRASWWLRLWLWLRGLVSVADRSTLLLDTKLRALRATIRRRNPELLHFESHKFGPGMAH